MNFWTQLENQTLTKEAAEQTLLQKLGKPTTELQSNLYGEILKKIYSYYFASAETQNFTTYSLFGFIQEISEKKYKEGKNKDQIYYVLKLGGGNSKEKLHAIQANLPEDKWTQITKLAILGKNLVFKYKKWITNKQLLDFYPQKK